eukprot:GFUD01034247.1.p1 GENE.GFUD01034247.1~~GFUD01034247.1.p1  ORF type:complete len:159 (+),score=49.06 GFUD01034247.1:56-532(+)
MKFSVEIETESHLFDSIPDRIKSKPSPLHWDIQVEVMQKALDEKKSVTESMSSVKINKVTTNSVSNKSVISSSIPEDRVLTQQTTTVTPTKTASKKLSSTSELMARMGKGRKVSRQGEWLVFTEKYGLLTTQNGTQQIIEKRVKLEFGDMEKLKELGF